MFLTHKEFFEFRGVSPTLSFSVRSEGWKRGGTPRQDLAVVGRSVLPLLVILSCVLAAVGELDEPSGCWCLPRPTAQQDPSPCLLGALPWLAAFSAEHFSYPHGSGVNHHCSWASWLSLSWGPQVAADWNTPFPACRVCNQRMRTRKMSIHDGGSLSHLRAQVGILFWSHSPF